MPPAIRRRGTIGVALALALTVCAFEAPAVSAYPTTSVDQIGAPISEPPIVSRAPTARPRPPDRRPITAQRPKPRPTQPRSDARRIIRLARRAVGADFRMGAVGQRYYDCSGLVYSVYKAAGLLDRVGGARRGATSFYQWFKSRGLVSRNHGRPGDLVVYQHKGENVIPHMGIYIGNGRVISALINPWGVRAHGIRRLPIPFKAFLHVRIAR